MGCQSSKPIPLNTSLLGRCWDTPCIDGKPINDSATASYWFPAEVHGQKSHKAYSNPGTDVAGVPLYAQDAFLKKNGIRVRNGIRVEVHNSIAFTAISSDTIPQCSASGASEIVSVSGTPICLGEEFTRVRTGQAAQSTVIVVVVVKSFELELTPAQANSRGFALNEVDVGNKNVFGVGIVTRVVYGGFLVIELAHDNYDAVSNGLELAGGVEVSPSGGNVGVGITSESTEADNAFRASVRRVGGDSRLINASFVNTSTENVLVAVDRWAKDLIKFPCRASPINLYLQSYAEVPQDMKPLPQRAPGGGFVNKGRSRIYHLRYNCCCAQEQISAGAAQRLELCKDCGRAKGLLN